MSDTDSHHANHLESSGSSNGAAQQGIGQRGGVFTRTEPGTTSTLEQSSSCARSSTHAVKGSAALERDDFERIASIPKQLIERNCARSYRSRALDEVVAHIDLDPRLSAEQAVALVHAAHPEWFAPQPKPLAGYFSLDSSKTNWTTKLALLGVLTFCMGAWAVFVYAVAYWLMK